MPYLVTGATGTVGGLVADQLVAAGRTVRLLVRDAGRVPATRSAATEVVEGDLTDADAVRRALHGVDAAFLNMADDNGEVFAGVAAAAGLRHVALLSSFTAVTALPSGADNVVTARHRAGERHLADAGVPTTVLRPSGFDYNIAMWVAAGAKRAGPDVVATPYPDVALPIVDPADIAASAVAALLADPPPLGAYSITGPAGVTGREQTAVLAELLGRSLRVEQIDEDEARRLAFPPGTPELVSRSVLETMGPAAAALEPGDGVERLTGRPPRPFTAWAADNAGSLR